MDTFNRILRGVLIGMLIGILFGLVCMVMAGCSITPQIPSGGISPGVEGSKIVASITSIPTLITLGLLAFAGSVCLIGLAPGFQKIGLAGILGSVALIAGSLAVQKYSQYFALTAVGVIVIVIVVSVMKRQTFAKELVGTVNEIRKKLPEEINEHLFGNTIKTPVGFIKDEVQSKETTEIVKKIKEAL